jgi:diguanylate cyclase (GGDEF)-like protein
LFIFGFDLYGSTTSKTLPLGEVRNNWKVLSFFIVGFAAYMFMLWTGKVNLQGINYPAICFAVSAFVLLLCFLAYQTTRDIGEAIAMDQASIIDPVLDIYNRRYFDRRSNEETQRSRRYNQPLSIILLGVDHFESIAKKHGRLVGDVVLRKISDFLVGSVRASDIVARYDEHRVVIASTQTKPDMAIMLVGRIRGDVEKLEALPSGEQKSVERLRVTVTAGVSCVEDRIKSGFDLTDVAEKAMSRTGFEGYNRVYAYDPSDIHIPDEVIEATVAA